MTTKTVTVKIDLSADQKTLSIAVSEEPVDLTDTDTAIDWDIHDDSVAAGWTFTTDDTTGAITGIRIKTPRGRFSDAGSPQPDRKHRWTRVMNLRDKRSYRYRVSVVNLKEGVTVSWDPSIMNN